LQKIFEPQSSVCVLTQSKRASCDSLHFASPGLVVLSLHELQHFVCCPLVHFALA